MHTWAKVASWSEDTGEKIFTNTCAYLHEYIYRVMCICATRIIEKSNKKKHESNKNCAHFHKQRLVLWTDELIKYVLFHTSTVTCICAVTNNGYWLFAIELLFAILFCTVTFIYLLFFPFLFARNNHVLVTYFQTD